MKNKTYGIDSDLMYKAIEDVSIIEQKGYKVVENTCYGSVKVHYEQGVYLLEGLKNGEEIEYITDKEHLIINFLMSIYTVEE